MAEAGCLGVFIGFETLNEEKLASARERTPRVDDYARRVRIFHEHGIRMNGSFVVGFDGDRQDAFTTLAQWIEARHLACATFHVLTPYPGTPLFRQLEAEGRLLHRDWDLYDTAHVVFRPKHVTPEELLPGCDWLYRRLFSHASIWTRRPEARSDLPGYLAGAYPCKHANRIWPFLIERRLVHAVWRPLVEGARRLHASRNRRAADGRRLTADYPRSRRVAGICPEQSLAVPRRDDRGMGSADRQTRDVAFTGDRLPIPAFQILSGIIPLQMRTDFHHGHRVISYLDVAGPGPAAPGRTLVLLHAFPLAAEMWQPQLAVVPSGWRVIAPDLRGFGESPAGEPSAFPSMDDHAEDVVALIDHLELGPVVVGGLSMGGYVAFALLRLAPARVAGLVLADTRAEADDDTARANRDRMTETLGQGGVAAVFERMLPSLLGATTRAARPDVVRQVRELAVAQSDAGVGDAIQRLKSRRDSTGLLAGIACPTLVVVGDEDQITSPDVARSMGGRIRGAELAVIEGAGHLSNLEQPGEFNQALARFLAARF